MVLDCNNVSGRFSSARVCAASCPTLLLMLSKKRLLLLACAPYSLSSTSTFTQQECLSYVIMSPRSTLSTPFPKPSLDSLETAISGGLLLPGRLIEKNTSSVFLSR